MAYLMINEMISVIRAVVEQGAPFFDPVFNELIINLPGSFSGFWNGSLLSAKKTPWQP